MPDRDMTQDDDARRDAELRVLHTAVTTMTMQIAEFAVGQRDVMKQLSLRSDRFDSIERRLDENTAITKSSAEAVRTVQDSLVATRVATKVIKWVGSIAIGLASLYAAIQMVLHGGGPPTAP